MSKSSMLIMAEMQLRGFCLAHSGYDVSMLVESMGLTRAEWRKLRNESFIPDDIRREIDEMESKL